jgi:hypothetical protein
MSLPFGFTAPQLLLLLVPAAALTVLLPPTLRSTGLTMTPRARDPHPPAGPHRLRPAGLQWARLVDKLTTVFVVDLSDSVGTAGRAAAVPSCARRPKPRRTAIRRHRRLRRRAPTEQLPDDLRRWPLWPRCPSRARPTSVARCLASCALPDETQKRIVLVSDGNDTTGHGTAEAALAAARVECRSRPCGRPADRRRGHRRAAPDAVDGARRRDRGHGQHHVDRPSGHGPALRRRADRLSAGRARGRPNTSSSEGDGSRFPPSARWSRRAHSVRTIAHWTPSSWLSGIRS